MLCWHQISMLTIILSSLLSELLVFTLQDELAKKFFKDGRHLDVEGELELLLIMVNQRVSFELLGKFIFLIPLFFFNCHKCFGGWSFYNVSFMWLWSTFQKKKFMIFKFSIDEIICAVSLTFFSYNM